MKIDVKAMAVSMGVGFMLLVSGCAHPGENSVNGSGPVYVRTLALPGVNGSRPGVGVPGRLDHMAYDPATQRLFVAALENGSLEVLDLESGQRVRSVPGLPKPQGLAIVSAHRAAALACEEDGLLHVYDTQSLEETAKVQVGVGADNVRYDAAADLVYVSHGKTNGGAIAVVDPKNWKVVREITFFARPESFQLERQGKRLFANLPQGVRSVRDGQVAAVDRETGRTEWGVTLKDRARNFPMSLDESGHRLFVATRRPARVVEMDTTDGKVVAETPCIDDSDDLFYDAVTGHLLVIGGGFRPDLQEPNMKSPCSPEGQLGAIDTFSVKASGELKPIGSTLIPPHARTGLFVPERRAIYVAVPPQSGRDSEILEFRVG